MGPKLMNCCKLEQVGAEEYGHMLKRTQGLEDGRVPAKEAKGRRIQGQKRRIAKKEYQRLLNKFEMEGFMAPRRIVESRLEKKCCTIGESYVRKRVTSLERTRLCMNEDNFLSSWLREDVKRKKKGRKWARETQKDGANREKEKGEENKADC